jgi:hypothetical protein
MQSFVGGTALLIIHVNPAGGAILAQRRLEIAFLLVRTAQCAARFPVMVFFPASKPIAIQRLPHPDRFS